MDLVKLSKDIQEFESLLVRLSNSIKKRRWAIEEETGWDFIEKLEIKNYFNILNLWLASYPNMTYRIHENYLMLTSRYEDKEDEFYIEHKWLENPECEHISKLFDQARELLIKAKASGLSPHQITERDREIKLLKELQSKYPDQC